ncbi:MAG: EAL domain-containing protein [Methylophaga sp.]|nr:EAL domain-containing protein [Methylophaga sp.]
MTNQRLLILDDDLLIGRAISGIAEFIGLDVQLTTDFDNFINMLLDWQPSHLMIDLIMPDKDGVEVLGELASRDIECQLILTSGAGEQLLQAAARSAAAHGLNVLGLLPKPFNPKHFRELMQQTANMPSNPTLVGQLPQRPSDDALVCADDLQQALENKEITIVLQPKVTCQSGALSGFEVLARWTHGQKGTISPDIFIPIAEQYGLIDQLTVQVFEQALPLLHQWQHNIASAWRLKLSVNISPVSLANEQLFIDIEQLCQQHQVASEQLILELTETAAMDDPVKSLDTLTRLRIRGFRLSIDDFGTGFSSMLALVRMPFSEVKIDKSFVMTAANAHESRQVIKATIDLAHSLDMSVTAEGIETQETLQQLQAMGCDLAQGYYIGRPMTSEQVVDWLNQRQVFLEQQRLQSLQALQLIEQLQGPRYERLTFLAQQLFDCNCSFITLIDNEFQWIKAVQGDLPKKTKRSLAFCNLTITQDRVLVVENASEDTRFARNPLVTGPPFIRFYAGTPIHAPSGEKLGALCVTDSQPQKFSDADGDLLQQLAKLVDNEIATNLMLDEDHLTGLLNRRGFEKRAETLLTLCHEHQHLLSMCYFDLDNFKKITAQQGQLAADESLINFAQMLEQAFCHNDLLARFGGDEFVVMNLSGLIADSQKALQKLASLVADFNAQQNPDLRVTYSYGFASCVENKVMDVQTLYTLSDEDLRSRRS